MCLIGIFLTRDDNGQADLWIAANRDEFHARPAAPARWWLDEPAVFAGRDLTAGGTWLGVSKSGGFAAVTNVREPGAPARDQSRGELPRQFLTGTESAKEFCRSLAGRDQQYAGFNLLTFDGHELWWCSNRPSSLIQVDEGIHGLSNAALNTDWPKVAAVKAAFEASPTADRLLATLADPSIPAGKLPDTGVGFDLERRLAPIFIRSENYGTRCSTVVHLRPGTVDFVEISYAPDGSVAGEVRERLNAP